MIVQFMFYNDCDYMANCVVFAVQYLNREKHLLVRPIGSGLTPRLVPTRLTKIIDDYIPLDWVFDEKRGMTSFTEYTKDDNFLNYLYEEDYFGIEKYGQSMRILEREERKITEDFLMRKHFDINKYKAYVKRNMKKEYHGRGFEVEVINNEIEKINLNRDIKAIIDFVISPPTCEDQNCAIL